MINHQLHNKDLIIEIDDEIAGLIEEINTNPQGAQIDFAENLKDVVIDTIMGPFGLSATIFDDRDGGNITTLPNFEKGIVANNADAERHADWIKAKENNFDRADYDACLDEKFPDMKDKDGKYYDGYKEPETELPVGPRTVARDHIIPSSAIERSSRGHLAQTREQRVETATQEENVVLTAFNMNSSKNDGDLLEWAKKPSTKDPSKTNAEYFELDQKTLESVYKKAKKSVERTQKIAVIKKQAVEFCIEGSKEAGKMAIRQVLGLILKELATGLIDDIRQIIRDGFRGLEHLIGILRTRMEVTAEVIKEKWKDFLAEGASAAFAGFLSSLVTLIINSFITTAKRIVTIIREGILAVVKSIKLIISPPEGMTGFEIALEVLKLLSGAIVTALTLSIQEGVAKSLEVFPLLAPFAQEIATVLVGILSGTLGLLTVLTFDRLKSYIQFQNKQLADVHRGQAVSFLKVKQTLLMLDSGYTYVQESTSYMQLQLTESWAVIEESSQIANIAVSEYSHAVEKFRELTNRN